MFSKSTILALLSFSAVTFGAPHAACSSSTTVPVQTPAVPVSRQNNGGANNLGNFGSCSKPQIQFAANLDGRRQTTYKPTDLRSYNRQSATDISVIAGFICDQLKGKCRADRRAQDTCSTAFRAAIAAPRGTGLQADAFNRAMGTTTNFAAVQQIDRNGKPVGKPAAGNGGAAATTSTSSSAAAATTTSVAGGIGAGAGGAGGAANTTAAATTTAAAGGDGAAATTTTSDAAAATTTAADAGNNGGNNGGAAGGDTGNGGNNGGAAGGDTGNGGNNGGAAGGDTGNGGNNGGAAGGDTGNGGNNGGAAGGDTGNGGAAGGNGGAGGDPQTSLTLDPAVIAKGFESDGQQVPTAGQVPSLTSPNNFINFCLTVPGKPITNGQQIKTGSCNPAPMGVIASTDNMPSSKFTFPTMLSEIPANQPFTISMAINNLQTGNFVNAQNNYYSAPQQVDGDGNIIGHTHVVVELLDSLNQTTPTDPRKFAFFKGVNGVAQGGIVTADVTAGLPAGTYRLASINAAANHQPVVVAVAQHGSLDDMVYFTVA